MPKKIWHVTPVDPSGVFIRSGSGLTHEPRTSAFFGEPLEVIGDDRDEGVAKVGVEGEWLNVRTRRSIEGFVAAWVVQTATVRTPPPPEPVFVRTTSEEGLRVRSGPGFEFEQVNLIKPEHLCEVLLEPQSALGRLGMPGEWIEIKTPSGRTGWAAAWLLFESWEGQNWQARFADDQDDVDDTDDEPKRPDTYFTWDEGHALVGIHGPADPGSWPWDGAALQLVKKTGMEAVKILAAGDLGKTVIDAIHNHGAKFILARLFVKIPEPKSPEQFVSEVLDATKRLYDCGIRYFEVHNEPNLHHAAGPEGMWVQWQNGKEFGDYFLELLKLLRKELPDDAQFGWPGISPGSDLNFPDGTPLRYNGERFLDEADFAVRQADFVCMHAYWTGTHQTAISEIRAYCDRYPDKLIFVTEFSNPTDFTAKDVKAKQYIDFYHDCQSLPSNLGGMFSYVLSSSGGFSHETWKDSIIPAKLAENRHQINVV